MCFSSKFPITPTHLTLACIAELSPSAQLGSFQTKLDWKESTQRIPAAHEHSVLRTRCGLVQSIHPPSPNAYGMDVLSTNYLVLLPPLVLQYVLVSI